MLPATLRRLLVATTNAHKAAEIREALAPLDIEIVVPNNLAQVPETGATFRDNALIKARAAARAHGVPALSDDSGLVVPPLGGEPGVRSSRYAGEGASDAENNARLVARCEARSLQEPLAAFVCAMVVTAPDGSLLAEGAGRVEGVLRWPALGDAGFGYDPLFFHPPSGCRFSELTRAAKSQVSHRGLALAALLRALAA